jgi:Cu-processing system permease protein
VYGLFFIACSEGLIRLTADPARVAMAEMDLVLMLIPLVSLIFGTMYIYNSRPFLELLLSQPIGRSVVFVSTFTGLAGSLIVSFVVGLTLPLIWHSMIMEISLSVYITLLLVGVTLTVIFVGLALLISQVISDRGKGLGAAILIWLSMSIIYDGLVLLAASTFSEYPLERPLIVAMLLNPIDLGRILMMMQLDIAALMGYTGAIFRRFFGDGSGETVSAISLLVWTIVAIAPGLWLFKRRDF